MSIQNDDSTSRFYTRRRLLVGLGLAATLPTPAIAEDWLTHRSAKRRAVCRRDIPSADYHSRKRTDAFRARSQQARLRQYDDAVERQIRHLYEQAGVNTLAFRTSSQQLPTGLQSKDFVLTEAAFGHPPFSLTGFSLTISDTLNWNVSLRADYRATDEMDRPTSRLTNLRHEFQVSVRIYSEFPAKDSTPQMPMAAAQAHIAELALDSFWVQRDQPKWMTFSGAAPNARRRLYAQAQFVEVEFFVYLDAFAGSTRTLIGRTQR